MTDLSTDVQQGGAYRFVRGDSRNGVAIAVSDNLLRVDIYGDPTGADIVACFREAYDSGSLNPSMTTLVDLTRFAGRVDWSAITSVGKLAPWGDDATRRSAVAYLTDSAWFGALLKLVTVLYPRTQHRQFSDEASALEWLRGR